MPDRATWAGRILADRADAGLEVAVGELRPYTVAELALLLDGAARRAGASSGSATTTHGELVDLDVAVIGAARRGHADTAGGSVIVTMISRAEWEHVTPEPPEPPIPPPDPWHVETRTYVATRTR